MHKLKKKIKWERSLSSHCPWVLVVAVSDKGCCYESVPFKLMVVLF